MSEKQAKRYSRKNRRDRARIIKSFMADILTLPFRERLTIAWIIVRKKRHE